MATIDETKLATLLNQGFSQRAIAEQLHISRSTLRRYLDKQKGTPIDTMGVPPLSPEGVPLVHHEFPFADDLAESWSELQEILTWWRNRQHALTLALDASRKRKRQTYHVEERFIDAIKRAADFEHNDIAEIVNRAFAQYFSEHHRAT